MCECAFCGSKEVSFRLGRLALCEECAARVALARPESAGYIWFVRAVRRALFAQGAYGGQAGGY